MIDHDRLFKELISTFFVEFLDLFLPQIAKDIDRDEIQFLPQEVFNDVTSGEKKEIDLLAQVRYQQQETYFLIHIENQSYSQSEFAKRMFKYFSRLYEKYDLPIYPVVIFSFDEQNNEEVYMEIVTSWKREGLREGRQEERRAGITKFLQLRFGEIDAQLEAIIPQLMELSTDEYMGLIYQASREDLLSRFHGES